MADRVYRNLFFIALGLTLGWVGWSIYDSFFAHKAPGDMAYFSANKAFEDGHYERALADYELALSENADHLHALRGKARSLMQLGRHGESLENFDRAISKDPQFAAAYANRGILYDRMGQYDKAIKDYETALQLDPEIAEGPHWLTRFLRNQAERPPSIADRANYLRAELAKPESQRLLRLPEADEAQRPYKM